MCNLPHKQKQDSSCSSDVPAPPWRLASQMRPQMRPCALQSHPAVQQRPQHLHRSRPFARRRASFPRPRSRPLLDRRQSHPDRPQPRRCQPPSRTASTVGHVVSQQQSVTHCLQRTSWLHVHNTSCVSQRRTSSACSAAFGVPAFGVRTAGTGWRLSRGCSLAGLLAGLCPCIGAVFAAGAEL